MNSPVPFKIYEFEAYYKKIPLKNNAVPVFNTFRCTNMAEANEIIAEFNLGTSEYSYKLLDVRPV